MSKLDFKGEGAGLGKELRNGDRSNPFNYVITCGCGTELGPLGRFRANGEGVRTPYCPVCRHVTIVKADGQIANYVPATTLLQKHAEAQAAKEAG